MPCGIYRILNTVTGNSYVGSAKDIAYRWRKHRQMLTRGDHHSPKLQRSWDKHGPDVWQWIVQEECPEALLIEREQFYIDRLHAYGLGYNMSAMAGRLVMSSEGRVKVAEANRSRVWTPEMRANSSKALQGKSTWNKGVPFPESVKAKLKASAPRAKSPEHRVKLAEHCRKLGEARRKPKLVKIPYQMTPEHREHIVEALRVRNSTGWQNDPEIRRKNSEGQQGRRLLDSTKQKISEANKGKKRPPRTEEQRKHYAEAAKAAHERKRG